MIFFFIFILILSIYEIKSIIEDKENDKKKLTIIIYLIITAATIFAGIYYYLNEYSNSITYYILKILNISY